jgi:hypothetical protein
MRVGGGAELADHRGRTARLRFDAISERSSERRVSEYTSWVVRAMMSVGSPVTWLRAPQ